MTAEIALYIIGAASLPILGWGINLTWDVKTTKRATADLIDMHQNSDEHGFGTGNTNTKIDQTRDEMTKCVTSNTHAIKTLTHYIRWFTEKQSGEVPPPPIEDK